MGSTSSTQSEEAAPEITALNADYDEAFRLAQRGIDIAQQILTRHQRIDGVCSCGNTWPCQRAESISRSCAESKEAVSVLLGPTIVIRLDQDEPAPAETRRRRWRRVRPKASSKA